MSQTNLLFFALNVFCIFVSILAICVSYWAEVSSEDDDSYYGVFFRETSSEEIVHSGCKSDMNEDNCSFLNAAKSCIVISILLGVSNIILFMYNGGNPGFGFLSFTMGLIGFLQATFLMMCVIIFSYFKEGYLETNDDINIEYPSEVQDADYAWAFDMMIGATVISYMSSTYHLCALTWPSRFVLKETSEDEDALLSRF